MMVPIDGFLLQIFQLLPTVLCSTVFCQQFLPEPCFHNAYNPWLAAPQVINKVFGV